MNSSQNMISQCLIQQISASSLISSSQKSLNSSSSSLFTFSWSFLQRSSSSSQSIVQRVVCTMVFYSLSAQVFYCYGRQDGEGEGLENIWRAKSYSKLMRQLASIFNILVIICFIYSGIWAYFLNFNGVLLMFLKIYKVVLPDHGKLSFILSVGFVMVQSQLNMQYRMSPNAQISDFSVQVSSSPKLIQNSSGEKNKGVPTRVFSLISLLRSILEVPKSAILMTPPRPTRRLEGLISRCRIFLSYMNFMPLRICLKYPMSFLLSQPCTQISQSKSSSVPPSHSSMTMKTELPAIRQSLQRMILGWCNTWRVWISFMFWLLASLQDSLMATGSRTEPALIRQPLQTWPKLPDPRGSDLFMMKFPQRQQLFDFILLSMCLSILYRSLAPNPRMLQQTCSNPMTLFMSLHDRTTSTKMIFHSLINTESPVMEMYSKTKVCSGESWDLGVYPGSNMHTASIGGNTFRCSIGRNGVAVDKKEGDGKTPVGTYPFRQIWYRKDKITVDIFDILMGTGLPVKMINTYDGWCDEPTNPAYNQHVDLRVFDRSVSHENLWREDDLYDCFLVVGYNDRPVVAGKGSAIFMHVARDNYGGTAGCVAFAKPDLWQVLRCLKSTSTITVHQKQGMKDKGC